MIMCTKCLNWNGSDCELDHTVYRSRLGMYFTDHCDDYEDVNSTKGVDEFLSKLPEEEEQGEENASYDIEPDVPEPPKRRVIPENKQRSNIPQRANPSADHFSSKAKDLIHSRKNREPLNENYDGPVGGEDDPLEELRRIGSTTNPLDQLRTFEQDVKKGKVDPKTILEENKRIAKAAEDYKIDDKEIEAQKEDIRRRLNIHGINEAAKKKAAPQKSTTPQKPTKKK